jgi:hypothetical protein
MIVKGLLACCALVAVLSFCHLSLVQASRDGRKAAAEVDRYGCLGTCSDYTIEIYSDGHIVWDGRHYVAHRGRAEAHVDSGSVAKVFAELFSGVDREICSNPRIIDAPVYYVLFSRDGNLADLKSLRDDPYKLQQTGLTRDDTCRFDTLDNKMMELERVADIHHWIYGNPFIELFARRRHKS